MVDFWDIVRSNPDTFLVVPDVVTSHDTGENRGPDICDGCDNDPETCGRLYFDCEMERRDEARECAFEGMRGAYD